MEPDLDSSYANLQTSLRAGGYLSDLEQLRLAMLTTMANDPDKAARMQQKLQHIDAAIQLLQENKVGVTSADMSRLMNMSGKIGHAIEVYRAKYKPNQGVQGSLQPTTPPQAQQLPAMGASVQGPGAVTQQWSNGQSPAAGMARTSPTLPEQQGQQQQQHSPTTSSTTAQQAAEAAGIDLAVLECLGMDNFDFLAAVVGNESELLTDEVCDLPVIDWFVPAVKPSGNLDSLLASEASGVLLQQQRAAELARQRARMSSTDAGTSVAESWLARVQQQQASQQAHRQGQQQQQQQHRPSTSWPGSAAGGDVPAAPAARPLVQHQSLPSAVQAASTTGPSMSGGPGSLVQHQSLPPCFEAGGAAGMVPMEQQTPSMSAGGAMSMSGMTNATHNGMASPGLTSQAHPRVWLAAAQAQAQAQQCTVSVQQQQQQQYAIVQAQQAQQLHRLSFDQVQQQQRLQQQQAAAQQQQQMDAYLRRHSYDQQSAFALQPPQSAFALQPPQATFAMHGMAPAPLFGVAPDASYAPVQQQPVFQPALGGGGAMDWRQTALPPSGGVALGLDDPNSLAWSFMSG